MIYSVPIYRHAKGWTVMTCRVCDSEQPVLVMYEVAERGGTVQKKGSDRHWGWCNFCEHEFTISDGASLPTAPWDPEIDTVVSLVQEIGLDCWEPATELSDAQVRAVLKRGASATSEGANFPISVLLLGAVVGSAVLTALGAVAWKLGFCPFGSLLAQAIFTSIFGIIPGVIAGIVVYVSREHPEKMLPTVLRLMIKNRISFEHSSAVAQTDFPKFWQLLATHRSQIEEALRAAESTSRPG